MTDKDSNRIAEEAAEYFARRAPRGTPTQRDDLKQWLQADSRHARAYDEARDTWRQLGVLQDDPEVDALLAADLAAMRRPRRWLRPVRLFAAAAVLVLVVGSGYLFSLQQSAPPAPVIYATALGEQRTETLADGTQVVLNTETELEVRYSRDRREIELQRGEAQFDVARDAARPFVVAAGEGTVTALGTRFQVRRGADDVVVTLIEGSVEVAQGDARRALQPHQQARLSGAGVDVQAADLDATAGWLDGWLRFRGTPLRDVLAEANRYSTRKMRLADPELGEIRFNGNFRTGDNASIASAVALILPVRVEESDQEIVLLSQ